MAERPAGVGVRDGLRDHADRLLHAPAAPPRRDPRGGLATEAPASAGALLDAAEAWARTRGHDFITLTVFEGQPPGPRPSTIAAATCPRRSRCASRWTAGRPVVRPSAAPEGLVVRPAEPADADALWADPPAGDRRRRDLCVSARHDPGGRPGRLASRLVATRSSAELHGRLAGTYLLKPNQPGLGSHVANCGYMVASWARGRGLGEALCRHSLDAARGPGLPRHAVQLGGQHQSRGHRGVATLRLRDRRDGARRLRPPGARRRRHPRDAPAALERFPTRA